MPTMTARQAIKQLLPQSWLTFYHGYIKGYLVKPQKSYSKKGEDLLVRQYFASRQPANGYYLDIGCFHPRHASNTHLLHKLGWCGFAVDVDDYKTALFARTRKGKCHVLTAAVVGKPQTAGGGG